MGSWKAKQPKARISWCHKCGKRLYAGGRSYVMVTLTEPGVDGTKVAVHRVCAGKKESH